MRLLGHLGLVLLVAGGCATAGRMNKISIGMDKAAVIDKLGSPDTVSAKDGIEYLNYRMATSFADFDGSDTSDYFVRLVNGKVDAYGKRGDFGTTAPPTQHVIIDQNQTVRHAN